MKTLNKKTPKLMEHDDDGDINNNWYTSKNPQRFGKGTR